MASLDEIRQQLRNRFGRTSNFNPPEMGVYHYLRQENGSKARIHLRVEKDGYGFLLINASRILHLNPTAVCMAYLFLETVPAPVAVKVLTSTYRVPKEQAKQDYDEMSHQLEDLLSPNGSCPICQMELETLAPFSKEPSAPYRMDLALTYRCNNNCAHCYNARPRSGPEMTTAQWKAVIDRLWDLRIPHIVFTGGEPTLRSDLPELIAYAEGKGQITGLNTNGRKLSDPAYLQQLVDAGLDHVQITLESHLPEIHDEMVLARGAWQETVAGVRNAVASKLYVMTNTTMLQVNADTIPETLDFLAELKVPTVGLNALIYSGKGRTVNTGLDESHLPALLKIARASVERHGQKLIWYTPTQYCNFDPQQLDLGVKGCTAALYNMCTEPDGSVIPCQSYYSSLGNILTDSWDSIWNHKLSVRLRERQNLPEACQGCQFLAECGGGCPLAVQAGHTCPPVAINPLQHEGLEEFA